MKTDSLKQIQEAIRILSFTADNLVADNILDTKEDIKNALECINKALYMETPSTSTKFDLYKLVANDQIRPVMCGVFHDEGYKVASDSHILAAVKEDYPEELEHHILDKAGENIDGKYPKWQQIFPTDKGVPVKIETAKVYELMKQVNADKKTGANRKGYVKVQETFFKVEIMKKLCTFMDAYGTNELWLAKEQADRRAAGVYAPDGSKALIMPTVFATSYGGYNEPTLSEVFEHNKDKYLWCEVA